MTHAIGVFNGNWKGGSRLDDVPLNDTQDVLYKIIQVCNAIMPFFTDEEYQAWCDAGPNDNAGFLAYAEAELRNRQALSVANMLGEFQRKTYIVITAAGERSVAVASS